MAVKGLRRYAAIGVGLLALSGVAAACGDDDSSTTTTTIESDGGSGATGGSSSSTSRFEAEIEERGKPAVSPVEGPVTELVVEDEVEGTGKAATPGSTVTAHYVGYLAANGEVFDSSWERGAPATFPLDSVIEGWSEGIPGMKEGGRRTLVIPAAKAYGENPPPGSGIPADADMVFVVDLVSVS
jgi:peptidylprolyl isomerase